MKKQFPIWQLSFPLCGVLIFTIGAFTTIYIINGRYLFNMEVTPQTIKITTDVDKREINLDKEHKKQEQEESKISK